MDSSGGMSYPAFSTFVTFPNGEAQDVAGCGFTVSGTTLNLTRAGQTLYSYQFSSDAAVRAFINLIMQAMLAYNTNPLYLYQWSSDVMAWQYGPIPLDKQPLYIQLSGSSSLVSASTCEIKDASGRVFKPAVDVVANTVVLIGPFNQPGSNTPALGNATIFVFDASGSIIGSMVIQFVNTVTVEPTLNLVQWFGGAAYINLPVNISPGSAFSFQLNGSDFPLNTEYVVVGGVSFLQTAVSATQITTGNFALGLPAGTYDLQLWDVSNNVLADFGNVVSVISS
jgi:hypothetical protein